MAEAAIGGTLVGCVGCMVQIESLSKASPGSMNLMTFSTFVFISIVGLLKQSRFLTVIPKNKVPLSRYVRIVILFFMINVGNNLSLNFDISVPLFIIFRSGTLLANLLLGRLLKNRIYTYVKIASVFLVTIGIITFTLADSKNAISEEFDGRAKLSTNLPFPRMIIGVVLLVIALFTSSYLGLCQEDLYRCYGRHPEEAMFFVHAMSLPGFFFLRDDIASTIVRFNNSAYLSDTMPVPRLWALLLSICLLQWLCITNVYMLTSLTTSLNVTMVVTLRKFLSLALSFYIFKNPFNHYHFFGASLVLSGTLAFTEFWTTNVWRNLFWKRKVE